MARHDILSLENVSAGYGKVGVLHDVNLNLGAGDTLAVVGANGAGKSTLLRAIMGQIPLMSGEVRFAGAPLARLSIHHRARLGIGYAPEGRQLFPAMSVEENLELGATRESAPERRRRIEQMMAVFSKLKPLRRTHCAYLSGGEQQMVAIARALMGAPKLLLLDEPSTGLAPKVISELYASLASLLDTGLTVLVAEQNARSALRFARYGIVFEDGRVSLSGDAKTLVEDPRVISAYVGTLGAEGWSDAPAEE